MDSAVLAATAWGGTDVFDTNVYKTGQLLKLFDPAVCQQVIYFSTASILDRNNQLLKEACELGTDHSSVRLPTQLSRLEIAPDHDPLPTLVLGGDAQKTLFSSLAGLPVKWIDLIRFFQQTAASIIHTETLPNLCDT